MPILICSSQNNLILHEHLYPNATRKAQRLNRRTSGGGPGRGGHTDRENRKGSFDFLRLDLWFGNTVAVVCVCFKLPLLALVAGSGQSLLNYEVLMKLLTKPLFRSHRNILLFAENEVNLPGRPRWTERRLFHSLPRRPLQL